MQHGAAVPLRAECRGLALSYTNDVSGREFRRHLRVQPDPSAPVRVDIMGNGFLDVLRARDISAGGLGIWVPHDFAGCDIEGEVELIVTLGRDRPFKTLGVIRHHSRCDGDHVFGLEFTALSPEQSAAIERYIAACQRRHALRAPSMSSCATARRPPSAFWRWAMARALRARWARMWHSSSSSATPTERTRRCASPGDRSGGTRG